MNSKPLLSRDKLAVLRFMSTRDIGWLQTLVSVDHTSLLRWLDESGIALHFLSAYENAANEDVLDHNFVRELRRRRDDNRRRVDAAVDEFPSVVKVLTEMRVQFAVLKGFAQVPDFCPDPYLRHSIDTDLLIHHSDEQAIVSELALLRYQRVATRSSDQVVLVSEAETEVSSNSYIYGVRREKQIELHTSLSSELAPSLCVSDWSHWLQPTTILGCSFMRLRTELAFVSNSLHALSHLFTGWVRLSWLWELVCCARSNCFQQSFWSEVSSAIGDSEDARLGTGMILTLAEGLFGPECLHGAPRSFTDSVPVALKQWISTRGVEIALADFPGNGCELQFLFASRQTRIRRLLRALRERAMHPVQYVNGSALIGLRPDLRRLSRIVARTLQSR